MCFNKKLVSRRCTGRAIKRLSRKEMRMEKIAGYMKPDGEVIHDLQNRVLELSERCHVLDMFIENSQDAIQISDRNLITLRVNRAYEVLTGIKREELIGVPVETLVKKRLISESCGALVAKTKKPQTIVQTFFRTGRSAHVSCSPVFDSNGEIEFFVCNDRDLDEISNLQSDLMETRRLNEQYITELESLKHQSTNFGNMVVEDEAMIKVLTLAKRIAKVDSTALLLGETGVGKDEVAHFIHNNSDRRDHNFVAVNCGAITESLFESELFGFEPHAFTGASNKRKAGFFEVADHGTLFLDEIGELSMAMQTKLLRVLQSHTFIRVGGNEPIYTDVRIIAATNSNLEEMVKERKFREDLYYRLSVIPIHIPPLRERRNDIIPLAQHFLRVFNQKYGFNKKLSSSAYYLLLSNHWEGNVRQLRNVIEQSVIITDSDVITPEFVPIKADVPALFPTDISISGGLKEMLEQVELQYLNEYYAKYNNIRDAAEQLKMSPTTFLRRKTQLTEKYKDRR